MSDNGKAATDTAAMYAAQQEAEGIDSDNYINAGVFDRQGCNAGGIE